jgi:hypothetical protein
MSPTEQALIDCIAKILGEPRGDEIATEILTRMLHERGMDPHDARTKAKGLVAFVSKNSAH